MEISLTELRDLLSRIADRADDAPRSDARHEIVVAVRGWVYVGVAYREGDQLIIHDASVIRRWGTTSGLGQLAREGPQTETVLDKCGRVEIPWRSVAARHPTAEPAKWAR